MYEYSKIDTLQKCEEHYDRMAACAESLPIASAVDKHEMLDAIGEVWSGKYCACCLAQNGICEGCILYAQTHIMHGCCAGLWNKMPASGTWGEFAENAKLVREYITTIKVALLMAT